MKILKPHAAIQKANEENLQNALRASLLLLPEEFTDDQLYLTITSLSYSGMKVISFNNVFHPSSEEFDLITLTGGSTSQCYQIKFFRRWMESDQCQLLLIKEGDVRMHVAENPNKVRNIVSKNKEHFQQLYKPYLEKFSHLVHFDPQKHLFKV